MVVVYIVKAEGVGRQKKFNNLNYDDYSRT